MEGSHDAGPRDLGDDRTSGRHGSGRGLVEEEGVNREETGGVTLYTRTVQNEDTLRSSFRVESNMAAMGQTYRFSQPGFRLTVRPAASASRAPARPPQEAGADQWQQGGEQPQLHQQQAEQQPQPHLQQEEVSQSGPFSLPLPAPRNRKRPRRSRRGRGSNCAGKLESALHVTPLMGEEDVAMSEDAS